MAQIEPIAALQAARHPNDAIANLDEVGFCAWVAQAEPGQALIYHHGFLAVDANTTVSRLPARRLQALEQLAAAAWRASEQDLIHLVQERLGPDQFAYIAIARPRPLRGPAALSALLLPDAA